MYGTRHLVYLSFFYLLCSVFSASLKRQIRTVGKGPSGGGGAPVNGTVVRTAEEKTAEYAVFALVPVFCIMGLLGILICNILKKKGYRCSTDKEGGDEETPTPQKEGRTEWFQKCYCMKCFIVYLHILVGEKVEKCTLCMYILLSCDLAGHM